MAKGLRANARLSRGRPGGVVPGRAGQGQAAERPARSARSVDGRPQRWPVCGRADGAWRMFTLMQTLRTPDDRFTDLPEFPYTRKLLRRLRRRRRDAADGLGARRPGRRRPGADVARRAVVVVPVPQDDPGAGRGRAPRHLPRPGRLRSLGQADSHRGLQLRAPRRVGAGTGFRRAGPAAGDPGRTGLGWLDRAAAGRRTPRTLQPSSSSPTPACPPATYRCRKSGGSSARRSRVRRRSTSAGSCKGAAGGR